MMLCCPSAFIVHILVYLLNPDVLSWDHVNGAGAAMRVNKYEFSIFSRPKWSGKKKNLARVHPFH